MNPFASWAFVITFPLIVNLGSESYRDSTQQRKEMAAQPRKQWAAERVAALNSLQRATQAKEKAMVDLDEWENKTWLLNQRPMPIGPLIDMLKERIVISEYREKIATDRLKFLDLIENIGFH